MKYNITQEEREFLLSIMPKIRQRARTKVRAMDHNGNCAYRADGNPENTGAKNCCFIGFIIPPDNYFPSLEGQLGDDDPVIYAIGYTGKLSQGMRRVLVDIQNVHDNVETPDWTKELRIIEKKIKG